MSHVLIANLKDTGRSSNYVFPGSKAGQYTFLESSRIDHSLSRWVEKFREELPEEFDYDHRSCSLYVSDAFELAAEQYSQISIDPEVMAGAPCIVNTRIPVYMILGVLESKGTVDSVIESYPRLTVEQVQEALGFARTVVECPIGDKASHSS